MRYILLLALCICFQLVNGQQLISEVVNDACSSDLENTQLFQFNEGLLSNNPFTESDALTEIRVSIPEGGTAEWRVYQNQEIEEDIYRLSGSLKYPGKYLSIKSEGSVVSGQYENFDGVHYNLVGCESNVFGFEVVDVDIPEETSCAGPESIVLSSARNCDEIDNCQATVRVLYLFTPAGIDDLAGDAHNYRSLVEAINFKTVQLNEALFKSGVFNKRIVASVVTDPYIIPGGLPALDSPWGTYYSKMNDMHDDPVVQSYRNQYNADLVYLITGYDEMGRSPTGVATSQGSTFLNFYAISKLNVWYWLNDNSHELGHLFGCHHENQSTCAKGYPFGFDTTDGKRLEATMVRNAGNSIENRFFRIYSNPWRSIQGFETGITDSRFCAAEISSHLCEVAQIDDTPEFEFTIVQYPDNDYCATSVEFVPNIQFGSPSNPTADPITYTWYYSTTPFYSTASQGTQFSTSSTTTLSASRFNFKALQSSRIYIRLEILLSDGSTLSTITTIELCDEKLGPSGELGRSAVDNSLKEVSFQQFITLEGEALSSNREHLSPSEYFLFDIQGRLIKSYSNFAELLSGYFLNDLDINPVVMSKVSRSTGLVESLMIVNK